MVTASTAWFCAVDLDEDSVRIVRAASELAQTYGAELRLVHAVGSDMLHADAPFQRFLMDIAVEKLASVQQQLKTHFETSVKHGDISKMMREAATDWAADLCIVGRGCANKPLGSLRTHVNAIIREAPCPVLSF